MSLFNRVGAAVGAGAADVEVALTAEEYGWNDTIQGAVVVRGGKVDQTASEIRVSVLEEWETRDSDNDRQHHERRHFETTIANDVAIATGSSLKVPFEIAVPEGSFSRDWSVAARVSVPRAVDRHGKTAFSLMPPAAIRGLSAALCAVLPFRLKSRGNRNSEVNLDFEPPKENQKDLDGVRLIVRDEGQEVVGVLEINPQEKSLKDRFKAALKKDRIKHPIRFPAEPLAAAPDGPASSEVVARLRELIAPHVE